MNKPSFRVISEIAVKEWIGFNHYYIVKIYPTHSIFCKKCTDSLIEYCFDKKKLL